MPKPMEITALQLLIAAGRFAECSTATREWWMCYPGADPKDIYWEHVDADGVYWTYIFGTGDAGPTDEAYWSAIWGTDDECGSFSCHDGATWIDDEA